MNSVDCFSSAIAVILFSGMVGQVKEDAHTRNAVHKQDSRCCRYIALDYFSTAIKSVKTATVKN